LIVIPEQHIAYGGCRSIGHISAISDLIYISKESNVIQFV